MAPLAETIANPDTIAAHSPLLLSAASIALRELVWRDIVSAPALAPSMPRRNPPRRLASGAAYGAATRSIPSRIARLDAQWTPTLATHESGAWRASRDPHHCAPATRAVQSVMIAGFEDALARYASGVLIDIGAGYVPYYPLYRRYVTDVITVDEASHPSPLIEVRCDLGRQVAVHSASAETVLCTSASGRCPPARLWPALMRILRPGGYAIAAAPCVHDGGRATDARLEPARRMRAHALAAGFELQAFTPLGAAADFANHVADSVRSSMLTLRQALRLAAFGLASHVCANVGERPLALAYLLVARKPLAPSGSLIPSR